MRMLAVGRDLEHFDDVVADLVPGKERSVRPSERHPGDGRLRQQLRPENDFALSLASRGSNTFSASSVRTAIIDERASVVTDCNSSPTAETIWSLMVLASVWLT